MKEDTEKIKEKGYVWRYGDMGEGGNEIMEVQERTEICARKERMVKRKIHEKIEEERKKGKEKWERKVRKER